MFLGQVVFWLMSNPRERFLLCTVEIIALMDIDGVSHKVTPVVINFLDTVI